jgi:hypothetical protein
MDGAIDLATLAGGLKGDDQQKVAAGIGIAAVPGMACLGNAAPLLPTIGGRSGFPRSPSEMRGVAKRSDVAPDIEVTKAVSLRGKLRSGEASTLMRLIAAADAREPKFDDCVAVGPFQSGENSYRGAARLKDKKVLLTGGDSGIGRAVALGVCARRCRSRRVLSERT